MSAVNAIGSLRNLIRTPSKLLFRSGPDIKTSFKESSRNAAEESNTPLVWSGLRGWYTPITGRYHTSSSLFTGGAISTCLLSNSCCIKSRKCFLLSRSLLKQASNRLALSSSWDRFFLRRASSLANISRARAASALARFDMLVLLDRDDRLCFVPCELGSFLIFNSV